ncbi:MAG: hypothetical protein KJO04_12065 [Bacteroidia bacterium]|nr:hypothetical protein [Bacteroidia bacterium]
MSNALFSIFCTIIQWKISCCRLAAALADIFAMFRFIGAQYEQNKGGIRKAWKE